jgi:nickel transport protein
MNYRTLITASALALFSTDAALAHATWITQRNGEWAVVHGEGSATDEAYDPAKVVAAAALDKTGAPLEAKIVPQTTNTLLTPAEGAAVLTATFDEGWWTEDAKGEWHNEKADAYPDFKGTGHYETYIVSYIAATEAQKATGAKLEIVPMADPTKLAMGAKLQVQVLLDGKPMEGVSVTHDVLTDWDLSSAPTDAEGKTTLVVANTGLNVAQVYHEVETGEKEISGHQAVLSFVTGGAED